MSTFRDAIADAINAGPYPSPVPIHSVFPDFAADAVIAMPEMQAIKRMIRDEIGEYDMRFVHGLPESVVGWVLDSKEVTP